ncbi:MAG: LysE family transporter [Alphaproteobacteria bacterium]|nr:LysE family transporter [Alphaproteobacteria bacterium]
MDFGLFVRGLMIGLAIAAPVGPIGVLCIRRSLAGGFALGFLTGMGAAAADGVYGAVAAFGLTAVSGFLMAQQKFLALGGGIALIWLGWQTARRAPATREAAAGKAESLAGAFASTFVLTLANPATILSFIAVFAGLGLGATPGTAGAVAVVAGVFIGSAAWWLFLAGAMAALHRQVPPAAVAWINRVSGAVLAVFGIAALLSLLLV